jgi:hypothetical protein
MEAGDDALGSLGSGCLSFALLAVFARSNDKWAIAQSGDWDLLALDFTE